jgi:hypothetical protein
MAELPERYRRALLAFVALVFVVAVGAAFGAAAGVAAAAAVAAAVLAGKGLEPSGDPTKRLFEGGSGGRTAEGFRMSPPDAVSVPPAEPGPPLEAGAEGAAGAGSPGDAWRDYRGAVDLTRLGGDAYRDASRGDARPAGAPWLAGRDRPEPPAAPCYDDEANDDEMQGDEAAANQGLARNDATRVTAGMVRRHPFVRRYLEEEVAEAQDREWWGTHEL